MKTICLSVLVILLLFTGCNMVPPPPATTEPLTQAATTPAPTTITPTHYLVTVSSQPSGGAVWLNGIDTGQKTPYEFVAELGEHTVVLKLDGYYEHKEWITVKDNDTSAFVTLTKTPEIPPAATTTPIQAATETSIPDISPTNSPEPVEATKKDEWKVTATAYLNEVLSLVEKTQKLIESIEHTNDVNTVSMACDALQLLIMDFQHLLYTPRYWNFDFIDDSKNNDKYWELYRTLDSAFNSVQWVADKFGRWADEVDHAYILPGLEREASEDRRIGLDYIAEWNAQFTEFMRQIEVHEWP